jgi:DNA mismatch repair ATPase MutS
MELDDPYLEAVTAHLKQLRFDAGVLISARLGTGLKGCDLVLRRPHRQSWRDRLRGSPRLSYAFRVPDRDEAGLRALSQLRDRGLNEVANALAQSCDHVLSFFRMLRVELGFYVGCVNLHRRLAGKGEPTCFPDPTGCSPHVLTCRGLYDVSLSLDLEERVVGNDVDADGIPLIVVTGANQGGKSTFLRSLGLAQLMMQAGMFVGASSLRANVACGVFTHFKRREDASMRSGKLDEELSRMSAIADRIRPGGMLLCNESFASTNEAEGSEIARQVIRAMEDSGVKVVCVTHMFDLADGFRHNGPSRVRFLRAERRPDGRRTFRVVEGEPLPTSFGEDLYHRILDLGPPDRPRGRLRRPEP